MKAPDSGIGGLMFIAGSNFEVFSRTNLKYVLFFGSNCNLNLVSRIISFHVAKVECESAGVSDICRHYWRALDWV